MVSQAVVLTTAAAVIGLPGVVLLMLRSPAPAIRSAWTRRARADGPAHRRLDRAGIGTLPDNGTLPNNGVTTGDGTLPDDRTLPPVERVAAELRRLYRQQHNGTAHGSRLWQGALSEAYDRWLGMACRHYDVEHHLAALSGMDRDLERMRVEAALTRHGLPLPPR